MSMLNAILMFCSIESVNFTQSFEKLTENSMAKHLKTPLNINVSQSHYTICKQTVWIRTGRSHKYFLYSHFEFTTYFGRWIIRRHVIKMNSENAVIRMTFNLYRIHITNSYVLLSVVTQIICTFTHIHQFE